MRYTIVEGSKTGHCCFEASVVDTERKSKLGDPYPVCECFSMNDAILIRDALNAQAEQRSIFDGQQ